MKVSHENSKVALVLCGGDINVSDLPIITNKSNAMIPVNGKPVIGWILDDLAAKGVREIVLVLRFDNVKLFNYVEWAYGNRMEIHFSFVQHGGTILHSLLSGLAWVKPGLGVQIVLGDTLLRDSFPDKQDFIFSGGYDFSEDWCLVKANSQGVAEEYYEKIKTNEPGLRALSGIYSLSDSDLLRKLVIACIRTGSKEISSVLRAYGKERQIHVIEAKEWYDFGHIQYFNLAKQKLLQSRYFNTLTIDSLVGTVTKTSQKDDKLANELNWYHALPEKLKLLTPRIIDRIPDDRVSITQEYYGYPSLAELYVFGDFGSTFWRNSVKKLLKIHQLFHDEKGQVSPDDVRMMYWEKTLERIAESGASDFWKKFWAADKIVINNNEYLNFPLLKDKIFKTVDALASTVDGSIIHGDFCFSNILFDLNSQLVRLIDPRGSFGKQKVFGDPRYDMAKLRHSISGCYDFIIADLFKVGVVNNHYKLEIARPDNYAEISRLFDQQIQEYGYQPREIKFIEGLLFISMVPLHQENPERQLAMALVGIMTLNEV